MEGVTDSEAPKAAVPPPPSQIEAQGKTISAKARWKALANAMDIKDVPAPPKPAEVVRNRRWSTSHSTSVTSDDAPPLSHVPKYLASVDEDSELVHVVQPDEEIPDDKKEGKAAATDDLKNLAQQQRTAEEALQISHMQRKFKVLKLIAMMSTSSKGKKEVKAEDDDEKEKGDFEPESTRHFLFDDTALKRGGDLAEVFKIDEPPEEDFNEIVDQDDRRIEVFVSVELVAKLLDSSYFKVFIVGLIFVNAALIGMQTDDEFSVEYRYLFSIFDHAVLSIFVCEILLKWYHGFWIFWQVGWNILDFVIILALLLGPQLFFVSSSRILRILRVLRAFRGLKSISAFAGLSMVVHTVLQSIPDMANIVLLLTIIMLMLAVGGVTLFGQHVSEFGNLLRAMYALFICVTQDGWVDTFNTFRYYDDKTIQIIGVMYYLVAVIIGAFVFANLIVAVVVTNLELAMKELKSEKEAEMDTMATSVEHGVEDHDDYAVPILGFNEAQKGVDFKEQAPLQLTDFTNLTQDRLEKYFVVLSALEDNLAEYLTIKGDLIKMYDVIRGVNTLDPESMEDLYSEIKQQSIANAYSAAHVSAFNLKNLKKGDVMSNLIAMQGHMTPGQNPTNMTAHIKNTKSFIRKQAEKRRTKRDSIVEKKVSDEVLKRLQKSRSRDSRD